ncbi:MAG: hypothetical protein EXR69_15360 [Myxococcales bacterium]|nr:hypothetical protein [Myxococcales bacterium]
MKYLIVAHGPAPDLDHAVTGGALRASVHEAALRSAGHEVVVLRREQDGPGGFRSPADLRRKAVAARPDATVCVAVEEAPALRGIAPLCVDLYAPRMLEAAFEGAQAEQAGIALRAAHAADEVLYSNHRQRWFWLGILGLAGWDLARPCGRIVPLACLGTPAEWEAWRKPPTKTKRPKPYFVAVGPRWPWQDPTQAITEAVAAAGDRAEVHVYGPSSGVPGAKELGTVSRRDWLNALAGSVALIDRYAPNAEREMATSFRQMDALATGTAILTDEGTALSTGLPQEAGILWEPVERAVDRLLNEGRTRIASAVAGHFAPEQTEAALLSWTPSLRARGEKGGGSTSVVGAGRLLAAARSRADAEAHLRAAAEAEVATKRAEIDDLHGQTRALVGAVEASAAALADVVAFRRETVAVLGSRLSGEQATREQLQREVATVQADLEKKSAEIAALTAERDRLQRVFRWR